jgi:dephospho-CoA kinase
MIDPKILAGIVYNDSDKLKILNSIVHPAVKEYIISDIKEKKKDRNINLYFIEAALLIEDGYKDICDEMWYIRTDLEVRINRLAKYRGMNRESAETVIANQKPDEFYIKYSDFVINNSGDFNDTVMQIRTKFIA